MPQYRSSVLSEKLLNRAPQQAADNIRIKVTKLLRRAKPPPNNISKEERSAIRDLRRDNSVIILPADKGSATVVLDRSEYEDKMMAMLECKQTYRELKKDPAPALERKMNAKLLSLKKEGTIPDGLYQQLRSSSGKTPQLHGLPKIHKP